MAFDGIVIKSISSELQQLVGARIDKIYQPKKNNIILGFYLNGNNYALHICTDSQNYRIHLTTNSQSNPKIAPNFCMVLRKHLIGLRIKNFITDNLERIITIEFEGFDDIDDIITKKLIVELMGRHCNVILLDDENTIIDSLRHINPDEENSNTRKILPHFKYNYPINSKSNFLDISSFDNFKKIDSLSELAEAISNSYIGISKSFVLSAIKELDIKDISKDNLNKLYDYIKQIIFATDNMNLNFKITENSKDYYLIPNENDDNFCLNFFIDDFYFKKENESNFKIYRDSVLKIILTTLKKFQKRLFNIDEKLKSCENMDTYRLYGELLTANLYKFNTERLENIKIENYYDNNNLIEIPLDNRYSPSENAKRYFKKYNKLKNTLEIVSLQKVETLNELNYIESIVYELESSTTIEEVADIFEEISENIIFKDKVSNYKKQKNAKVKKSTFTKNKTVSFNPMKYTIEGYTFLVGRNNVENDYLSLKYSKKSDLWFHTKDIHGSHAVLKLDGKPFPSEDILLSCAEIAAFNSKAKNSSNVPVDFCEVKYVKKPNNAKPGMVIYTNQKTLYVNPKNHT